MSARPALKPYYDQLKQLPEEMRSKALAITLDLKVMGKQSYQPDDLCVRYDETTEVCTVEVKKAYLKE